MRHWEQENVADTLGKFRGDDELRHREMCRQIADDCELAGADRERFLRKAKAIQS